MAHHFLYLLLVSILAVCNVQANVEKTIFLGPSTLQIPIEHPTISDLQLPVLTPSNPSIRTSLEAQFPNAEQKDGVASWFLLEGLTSGKRYEVRVCWPATQPTSFLLNTYELTDVFATSELITSLANYSQQLSSESTFQQASKPTMRNGNENGGEQSMLLLQIFAAADYYTSNKTLMENVPPVLVDVILDPFIFNVFPQSLTSTAVYILIITVVGWFVAKKAAQWMVMIAETDEEKKNK